jgi:pimeloyl-ACP methyl ester carboxylesterase
VPVGLGPLLGLPIPTPVHCESASRTCRSLTAGGDNSPKVVSLDRKCLGPDLSKIKRATLAGYSLAGNELTEFAALYPERIVQLVYLDAAYDLPENADLGRKAGLDLKSPDADHATLALITHSNEYHPDYTRIRAPALGFFVAYDDAPQSSLWDTATKAKLLAYWNDYGKAYRREQIDRFQRDMKNVKVVELHNTTHGGFVFEKDQQSILIREMRRFLLGAAR